MMARPRRLAPGQLELAILLSVPLPPESADAGPTDRRRAAQRRLSAAALHAGCSPALAWRQLVASLTGHTPAWWLIRAGRSWLSKARPSFHLAAVAAANRAAVLIEQMEPGAGRGAVLSACRAAAELEIAAQGPVLPVPLAAGPRFLQLALSAASAESPD
jgi:hypothetical protein